MIVTGIGQCSLAYLAVADVYPHANSQKEVLDWYEQVGRTGIPSLPEVKRFLKQHLLHPISIH